MDADESIDSSNREKLRLLFNTLPRHGDEETDYHSPDDHSPLTNVACVMNCWSVSDDTPNSGTVVQHVRVFRNRPDVRWKYRVHEQILPALRATGAEVVFTDIVIQHRFNSRCPQPR